MKVRHRKLWLALAPILLTTVIAPAAASATAPEEPQAGGALTWLGLTEVTSLDPAKARASTAVDGNPLAALYDQLIRVEDDGTITPRLALSVESDDATVWTITLREGLGFSDGTPFDAAAVTAHWDRMLDPATASPSVGDVSNMASYRAVDPLTVEVTLVAPNGQFPRLLTRAIGMIPSPTAVEAAGDGFGESPVGAGPFVFGEWTRDDHLTMERNPGYWDAPKPYLDEVTFRPIPDPQQRADTLASGDADVTFYVGRSSQVAALEEAGFTLMVPELNGGIGMAFNTTHPPFDDRRMRLAFAFATDLDDYLSKATAGGTAVDTLFLPSSPFYDDALVQPTNDLAQGQALVDEYIAEFGGPVQVSLPMAETQRLVGEVLLQQWSRLEGVEINLEVIQGSEALRRQLAGEFDIAQSAAYGIDPEPIFYDRFHSGTAQNFGGFANDALDAALEAGRSGTDEAARREAYLEFQEILWAEMPYVFLDRLYWPTIVGDGVAGMTIVDDGVADLAAVWMES